MLYIPDVGICLHVKGHLSQEQSASWCQLYFLPEAGGKPVVIEDNINQYYSGIFYFQDEIYYTLSYSTTKDVDYEYQYAWNVNTREKREISKVSARNIQHTDFCTFKNGIMYSIPDKSPSPILRMENWQDGTVEEKKLPDIWTKVSKFFQIVGEFGCAWSSYDPSPSLGLHSKCVIWFRLDDPADFWEIPGETFSRDLICDYRGKLLSAHGTTLFLNGEKLLDLKERGLNEIKGWWRAEESVFVFQNLLVNLEERFTRKLPFSLNVKECARMEDGNILVQTHSEPVFGAYHQDDQSYGDRLYKLPPQWWKKIRSEEDLEPYFRMKFQLYQNPSRSRNFFY